MKKVSCFSFTFVLLAALGGASIAHAQSTSESAGNIQGTVVDPSGALIPQAQITISNADGFSHSYQSDSAGGFDVSALAPGNYSVSVSAVGFTSALESVEVKSGQTSREAVKLGITVDQEIEVYAR